MFGAIAGGIASALAGGAMSKLFGGGQKAASGGIQGDVLATDNNTVGMGDVTRRRILNEWEAFKKVISRRNIRRRITIPLTLSNLKLLRRITRTENILHRNFTRRQVAI